MGLSCVLQNDAKYFVSTELPSILVCAAESGVGTLIAHICISETEYLYVFREWKEK